MIIRVVSWNLNVRKNFNQWTLIQSLRPDIALLQEWRKSDNISPSGNLSCQEYLPQCYTAIWSKWPLRDQGNFPTQAGLDWEPYRSALEGYVVSATVSTPVGPLAATSVHAYPSRVKPEWLASFDSDTLRLPGAKEIWPGDLVWWALKDWPGGAGRAVIGGDWNTSRALDDPRPSGNQEFFDRMRDCGWDETARRFFPDERESFTWRRKGARPMQLDHLFASPELAPAAVHFEVIRDEAFERASDHFPLVAEFDLDRI